MDKGIDRGGPPLEVGGSAPDQAIMRLDFDEVRRSFPWVKEVYLFGARELTAAPEDDLDLLVVSSLPPREVLPGQRDRFIAQLRANTDIRIALRLTTSEQLAKWLAGNGRFASAFRRRAVKLFEQPPDAS